MGCSAPTPRWGERVLLFAFSHKSSFSASVLQTLAVSARLQPDGAHDGRARGHLGPERIITGLRARTRQLPLEFGKYKLNPRLGIDGCHG